MPINCFLLLLLTCHLIFSWHFISYQRLNAGIDPCTAFLLSSEAAMAGAESTKQMQAQVNLSNLSWGEILCLFRILIHCLFISPTQAGRSTYVSGEILASVPDPGAMAAASWYRAAALAVKDKYQASWPDAIFCPILATNLTRWSFVLGYRF